MTDAVARPPTTVAALDDEQHVTCPLCHADAPLPLSAIEAGRDWHCGRCGQQWDAKRLATVEAYARWAAGLTQPTGPSDSTFGSIAATANRGRM